MYLTKKISYVDLTPSSHSLQGHIQRCHFVVRQGISLLDGITKLDPCNFGWAEVDGYILPEKQFLPLPAYFVVRCGCKKKSTGQCACVKHETNCTEFCQCKQNCINII